MLVKSGEGSNQSLWARFAEIRFWLAFLLLLSAGALGYDFILVFKTGKTWLAGSYPSTPGTITQSGFRRLPFFAGSREVPDIRFEFSVNGQHWIGDRLQFFGSQPQDDEVEPPVLILDEADSKVIWPATATEPEFSVARSQLCGIEIDVLQQSAEANTSSVEFSIQLRFTEDDGQSLKRCVIKSRLQGIVAPPTRDDGQPSEGLFVKTEKIPQVVMSETLLRQANWLKEWAGFSEVQICNLPAQHQ